VLLAKVALDASVPLIALPFEAAQESVDETAIYAAPVKSAQPPALILKLAVVCVPVVPEIISPPIVRNGITPVEVFAMVIVPPPLVTDMPVPAVNVALVRVFPVEFPIKS
jgi:hypothetical protein